jgi:hypothetical protein
MRRSQPRVEHLVTAWEGIEGSKTVRTQMAYAKALIHPTGPREQLPTQTPRSVNA